MYLLGLVGLPLEAAPLLEAPVTAGARVVEKEPWASVDDVAKHLGIAKDTVYRWIESKSLPAHKVGRLWKFKLSEVDNWVLSRGAEDVGSTESAAKKK